MTACVNRKHTKKVAAVVTASLVGALSLGAAPVAAVADTGIDMQASDQDNWANGSFEFSVKANANGSYSVKEGETLSFVKATDVTGNEYTVSDVTVIFTDTSGKVLAPGDTIATRPGTMPKGTGSYKVYVIKGDLTTEPAGNENVTSLIGTLPNKAFNVSVTSKTQALSDVQVFEYNPSANDDGVSDSEFNYTGAPLKVAFMDGGKVLDEGTDYTVAWISGPESPSVATDSTDPAAPVDYFTPTAAGTYTARVKGTGSYSGTVDVTFTIEGIDLATADVAVSPVTNGTTFAGDPSILTVNGVQLDANAGATVTVVAKNDEPVATQPTTLSKGKYTIRVDAKPSQSNVKGSKLVDLYVVDNMVTYKYNGSTLSTTGGFPTNFDPALGMSFTTAAFSAEAGGDEVPFTVKVTKDGQEVTSFDETGTYKVVLDTPRGENAGGTYAGHLETSFSVGKVVSYAGSTVYVSIDGKNIAQNAAIDYTGNAMTPVVAALDSSNDKLVEGTDYTWKLVDAEGNEVESATEVGSYTIVVTFADNTTKVEYGFDIDKAEIKSAKAAADFFAIPADGSAAVPTFVGSTNADFDEGVQFDLDADQISVAYYGSKKDADGKVVIDTAKRVAAKDLTKAGTYFAKINILSTAENIEGISIPEVEFVLAESVAFTDVDANAWYADPVYKAAELKYMNGISGTRLFMPEANITRAEIACVMFNMAGGVADPDKNYPTGFEDVAADTWYSQAVAWASQNGVINGYDTGLYGTFDNATREQVAAILYNYADAQGMDVSVDDVDATLAKFDDGAQVSDWAKEAVAWAVENGVMGNGGFLNPTGTITRAEVAAMAVNFQPEAL